MKPRNLCVVLELYNLESRLGVTKDREYLQQGGYGKTDYNFTLLNADPALVAKKVADTEPLASTILKHAKSLQRLVGLCEDFEALNSRRESHIVPRILSKQREEV